MYSRSADLYDLLYADFKDYETEADLLAARIRSLSPGASRLLDVACGTGEHARNLARRGFSVDGVDLEPRFVELARQKNPDGRFVQGDMMSLDVGRRYDVVLCLFGSIGYVRTVERLGATLAGFVRHLQPSGLVLVEPWFEPGRLTPNKVLLKTAEGPTLTVCRMSRTEIVGRLSRLHFEYLVGDAGGLRRCSELHELGLFTREEMERAFCRAGLEVELDEDHTFDRGLYVGRLAD